MNNLTAKQEKFALAVLGGASPVEAYKEAGYSEMKPESVAAEASKLMKNPKIAQVIKDGREQTLQETVKAVSYSRIVAIERLEQINQKAFNQLTNEKFISRDALNAFLNSLDRLEDLTTKQKTEERNKKLFGSFPL